MWVEIFNIEKCRSVDEPAENSTVIPERPGKGAGTHRQASEKSSSLVEIIAPRGQAWGDKHLGVTSLGIALFSSVVSCCVSQRSCGSI